MKGNSSGVIIKTVEVLACLSGVLSITLSTYYFYQYEFTAKLWLVMIPYYKLIIGFIIGILSFLSGYLSIKRQKKVYQMFSLVLTGFILFHWLVYVQLY